MTPRSATAPKLTPADRVLALAASGWNVTMAAATATALARDAIRWRKGALEQSRREQRLLLFNVFAVPLAATQLVDIGFALWRFWAGH